MADPPNPVAFVRNWPKLGLEQEVEQAIGSGDKRFFILGTSAEVISAVDDRLSENIAAFIRAGSTYGTMSSASIEEN